VRNSRVMRLGSIAIYLAESRRRAAAAKTEATQED
jgi:hypothetical protein